MSGVAVIIPCRNLGQYLPEAIASAVAQTRPPQEIIVVDDGSDDLATQELLRAIECEGHRVLHTGPRGLAAARNTGISATQAPYIVTLDADDCLQPRYLEATAEVLDREPAVSFVATKVAAFGVADWVWTPPVDLEHTLGSGAPPQSATFRRDVWVTLGGYDESLSLYEDFDFWVRAMSRGFCGTVLEKPLLRYRVRPDSIHHRSVHDRTHAAGLEAVYRKHRSLIEMVGVSVLEHKERLILTQRADRESLQARRDQVESELRSVEREIAELKGLVAGQTASDVNWGDFRRLKPFSDNWGVDRGGPLDRYYIDAFLLQHRDDIRGTVLEVKDAGYARRFGSSAVERCDVLDVNSANEHATVVADLANASGISSNTYDCFILTQTLHLIYDCRSALRHAYRILKQGGTLLCTVPAVSRISFEDRGLDGDFWRFTEASLRRLFTDATDGGVTVTGFGNVLCCAAFLYGLSPDELTRDELDTYDPYFPLLYTVRVVKR